MAITNNFIQKWIKKVPNIESDLEDVVQKQESLDYVCPEWFASYNVLDSSDAIIEAINYASVNKKNVKLTGEYIITKKIICPSDTHIFGFGKNKTKIIAKNNGGFEFIGVSGNIKKNFSIKELSLLKYGSDKVGYGVSVAYATNFDFKNCVIEGFDLGVAISYSWVGSFIGNWIANNNTGVKLDKKLFALSKTDDQNAIVFDGNNQFLSNVVGLEINGGINNKILNNCFEGNKSQALIIRSVYDLYIEKNYMEHNGIINKTATITIDKIDNRDSYSIIIKQNRITGSNLSDSDATFGIDIINGGYNGVIIENSFQNNKKGCINFGQGYRWTIDNQYVGGNDPFIVGTYKKYIDNIFDSNIMQFNQSNKLSVDITANFDNVYSVYPILDANGEYKLKFIEYTGNKYQVRDLDTVQDLGAYLPTAKESRRGQIGILKGGTGVADKIYICIKDSDDTYKWKQIQFIA